jgi:hypothetical protein
MIVKPRAILVLLLAIASLTVIGLEAPARAGASSTDASTPSISPSASPTYERDVVLVRFDHELSSVDQEKFELRYMLQLESVDSSGLYRFRIGDGIDAAWKADSIRKGTKDGVTWAGTTLDKPPSGGWSNELILVLTALVGLLCGLAAGVVFFLRRRRRMEVARVAASGTKRRASRSDRAR